MSSFSPRPGPQRAWLLQVEVWLLLAELYLSLDQLTDVQQCIQEAMHIYPLSHHIMHMVHNSLLSFTYNITQNTRTVQGGQLRM